jgi:hypothetical protein
MNMEYEHLRLVSTSRASDAGYLALADLADVAARIDAPYRIVGGHMATLLVAIQGVSDQVPVRETLDADFGAPPEVVADPRLLQGLCELGYASRGVSNRLVRSAVDTVGGLDLVVDILAPSYQGRILHNQRHGTLFVDEIPGLAFALSRSPVTVDLRVRLNGGSEVSTRLLLPDLISALCMKALAYRGRYSDKDAVDLWRLTTAAYVAGLRAESWPTTVTGRASGEVLRRFFGRPGAPGLTQLSRQRRDQTRMLALVRAVVPNG